MTTIEAPTTRSHAIGTDLTGVTTVEEALTRSDMDWGLTIRDATNLTLMDEDGMTTTSIPDMRMVMRTDNGVTLGIVGGRYETIDNREVFSLAEHFLAQGARFTEGGVLDHGRRVFMRMALPDDTVSLAGGQDLVKFGVKIVADHSGSGNVTAGLEGTRLVCTNGMTARIKNLPHVFKVRHTASAQQRMAEAQSILSGATQYVAGFTAIAQEMLDRSFTEQEFRTYIDGVFPHPSQDEGRAVTMWENRREELIRLYQVAGTNAEGRGTAWGAYNAVTEYLDWSAPVRATKGRTQDEVRARRQFDGTKQDVKDLAFSAALAVA